MITFINDKFYNYNFQTRIKQRVTRLENGPAISTDPDDWALTFSFKVLKEKGGARLELRIPMSQFSTALPLYWKDLLCQKQPSWPVEVAKIRICNVYEPGSHKEEKAQKMW